PEVAPPAATVAPVLVPPAPVAMAPAAPVAPPAAPIAAPPAAAHSLPRAQAFALPIDELQQVAAASGLQWVNSDAEKIASVQAAIAVEPQSIHVPRERPSTELPEEGPLVLVETRRDLSAMALPFEQTPPA
ncbi:ribonuclease E/G, partial [Verminephrobacter aporrectodeae subsp. tuberculatae]|nr:ribonuclease E/G [Verminephrobacter aporrectodeae subsp. tuberculatae]